ncbi:hypothetical protein CBM2586_B10207 [Cupriavidus phytorum]|uniref:Uncharacterized protein n=1 Tax=Cupriavidus taiwanensis TaxID=164546 RepID=A0A375C935_9BURK|nr:hypothetical protein [Cupriavidus taiwanensis]SOY65612.1 hypothetical protein CBM2586_B10207 [Cupriavidus taiwanensis]
MGIEELKLVLQTLSGLADGAKEGFIWWLIVTEVLPRVVVVVCATIVALVAWKIAKLIADYYASESRCETTIRHISAITGKYVDFPYPSRSYLNDLVEEVRKLKGRA